MMTDVHSHILFSVDDGAKDINESILILKLLLDIGFDNVILTPHYIDGSKFHVTRSECLKKYKLLKEEIKRNKLDINIYLGNEIYIAKNIISNIENGIVSTLNDTKYFLFEIPFRDKILNLEDIVYEMKRQGYVPVLAHPERYLYFQNDYKLVDKIKSEGLLFQANYASITGHYGNRAKKLLKYMLKKHYIDYFGTDIHRVDKTYEIDSFNHMLKKIKRIAGNDYYNQIIENQDKLIKGED